jgi:hypothetical protein
MFGKNPPFEKVEPNPIPKGKVDFSHLWRLKMPILKITIHSLK